MIDILNSNSHSKSHILSCSAAESLWCFTRWWFGSAALFPGPWVCRRSWSTGALLQPDTGAGVSLSAALWIQQSRQLREQRRLFRIRPPGEQQRTDLITQKSAVELFKDSVIAQLFVCPSPSGLTQSFNPVAPGAAWTAGGGRETGHSWPFGAESPEHLHKRCQCSGWRIGGWVLVHRSHLARLGHFGLEQTLILHWERSETSQTSCRYGYISHICVRFMKRDIYQCNLIDEFCNIKGIVYLKKMKIIP